MEYSRESDTVSITDLELSDFAYKKANIPVSSISGGFKPWRDISENNDIFELEPSLEYSVHFDDQQVNIKALPDKVYLSNELLHVSVVTFVRNVYPNFNITHNATVAARGVVCARAAAETYSADSVRVVLTMISRDTGESISFYRDYTKSALDRMVDSLMTRAAVFISVFKERNSVRLDEIKKLTFPYKGIRAGQHDLMLGVMKNLRKGGKLLAGAPTGTGKTMATLYPSVKALGEGFADRIFYLTGKTVTGKAAFDSMKLLSEGAPSLRCIMVHSKERSCAEKEHNDTCFTCRRMCDCEICGEILSYNARRDHALTELLSSYTMYDGKLIEEFAGKYSICPYELSLDVSEYCDCIICDYNYVFDAKVRFRRYFTVDRGEKYVFLVDECHNLPDRVRSSYSATVSSELLDEVKKLLGGVFVGDVELGQAINAFDDALLNVAEECRDNASIITDKTGDHTVGFMRSSKAPHDLVRTGALLGKVLRNRSRDSDEFSDVIKRTADGLVSLGASSSVSDEGFAFLAELVDSKVKASLICIDPSVIITEMTACAHATVMFSATLNPTEYFADMLGMSGAPLLMAESPFDKNNLSVTVFDGISTKLQDRKSTARDIAEAIGTVLASREGHYFVFFPSYAYMKTVARELLSMYPDLRAVMQKQTMTYADREKFLTAFRSKKFKSIVGLCVLGGVFSEGVDLAGEGLIGVIVVGAGLPGISSELNLMSEYFEDKYGRGRLYAYEYPAINRIEQAAGRVIRTATDRGVVVLIDDRLSSPEMAARYPDFWPQIACTSDIDTLSVILERFWSSFNDNI